MQSNLLGPNGTASGWQTTGARYLGKIVTGVQGGKKTTTKMIYFLFFSEMPTKDDLLLILFWDAHKIVGIWERNKK